MINKSHIIVLFFALFVTSLSAQKKKLIHYVNPFIGTTPVTDSAIIGYALPKDWRPWSGLVFPGSSLPNAMVQLSPITAYGSGAGYQYEDDYIFGFTHTNKGHWNLCNIPILPVSATKTNSNFGSHFSHKKEKASPAYYQVFLSDYKVNVRLTSTLRCGYHQYQFANNKDRKILFDLGRANNTVVKWDFKKLSDQEVSGYQQTGNEKVFFYVKLNKSITNVSVDNKGLQKGYILLTVINEPNENKNNSTVEIKIGMSFVSAENAKYNLQQEIGNTSFDEVKKQGEQTWEKVLQKIRVRGGSEKQKQMFYSCFYRSLLWPALRSDINGEFTDVKGKVVKHNFDYYTVPSLWDTYRNKDVFLSLISPDITLNIIKSLIDIGDKTGFIPTFFHGDHATSSITGAYLRGIADFDVQKAYQLLLRNATVEGGTRPYIKEYISNGYISEISESNPHVETKGKAAVSKTLEYAYDDYSLAQLAKALGDSANYRMLLNRSENFKNVFDSSTRFMRGKLENGEWVKKFNPQYPYYEYMYREANAWQLSFYVPHNMPELVNLYGGPKNFESKLDSFFTLPWNPHYIARNVETMIGQYCHGNQPDHEAPFSYYFIQKPEKSQRIIDTILNNLYGIGKEGLGLSGMDDAGEMSAWYVFCALGLYPFSATDPEYLVTVPVFDQVEWTQPNGNLLTITKTGKSRVLKNILLNASINKSYFIPHSLFKEGGKLIIETE